MKNYPSLYFDSLNSILEFSYSQAQSNVNAIPAMANTTIHEIKQVNNGVSKLTMEFVVSKYQHAPTSKPEAAHPHQCHTCRLHLSFTSLPVCPPHLVCVCFSRANPHADRLGSLLNINSVTFTKS